MEAVLKDLYIVPSSVALLITSLTNGLVLTMHRLLIIMTDGQEMLLGLVAML